MKDLYLEKQKDINVSLFNNLNNFFESSSSYQKPLKKIKFKKKIDGFFVFSLSRRNCMILITNPKGEVKYKFTSGLIEDLKNVRNRANTFFGIKKMINDSLQDFIKSSKTFKNKKQVYILCVKGFYNYKYKGFFINYFLRNKFLSNRIQFFCILDKSFLPHNGCRLPKNRRK